MASSMGLHIYRYLILFSGYFIIRALVLRRGDPTCDNPHIEWDLWYGIFIIIIFALGFLCVLCSWVKTLHITRLTLETACLACLGTVLVFIFAITFSIIFGGTNAKDSKRIESYYRLDSYAPWAVKFLLKDNGWTDFRNCLYEKKICERKLDDDYYYENGCCAPPPYCGFQDQNKAWVIPKYGLYANDTNCRNWSSEKTKWCHQCETCQAVYINILTNNWAIRGLLTMFGLPVLVICFGYTWEQENNQRQQPSNRTNNNVKSNPSTVQSDLPSATA